MSTIARTRPAFTGIKVTHRPGTDVVLPAYTVEWFGRDGAPDHAYFIGYSANRLHERLAEADAHGIRDQCLQSIILGITLERWK